MISAEIFLEWHRTVTHSIVVSVMVGGVLAATYSFVSHEQFGGEFEGKTPAGMPALQKTPRLAFFVAVILAGLLHLGLDAAQSSGTMIFWPVTRQRVALDWLPRVDPWIIAILLAALLLPELTRLVSDEIGAKSKAPTGRIGAIVGLVILALYVGWRADLHSSAIAILQNRSYDTGSPRRVAAYPEAGSLFEWQGMVETVRALHQPIVNVLAGTGFDPNEDMTQFKPEPSAILDQAQQSRAAKRFLTVAAFPKAGVVKTAEGYEVEIRDLRYAAIGEGKQEVEAQIELDGNGKLLNDLLVWASDVKRR